VCGSCSCRFTPLRVTGTPFTWSNPSRFEGEEQGVQVRRLGRPLESSGHGALQGDEVRPGRLQSEGRHQRNIEHRASVRAEQFGAQPVGRHRAGQDTPQIYVNCQVAVRVICVEPGAGPEVAHMHARRGHEKHVTLDSADLPVILPFEIRAIREAVDLDGHRVGARLQERRDVELGRSLAPLAVSDLAAVHPQIHGRFHAAEVQEHLHACPILRHFESPAIRSHGVPIGRHARWIRREGIGDVRVDRDAVAEHLPVRRHRDLVPRVVVEVGAIEISRAIRRISDPVEPTGTAQRPNERRSGRIARQRTFPIRKRIEGGSRRLLVPFEDGGVFEVGMTDVLLSRRCPRRTDGEDEAQQDRAPIYLLHVRTPNPGSGIPGGYHQNRFRGTGRAGRFSGPRDMKIRSSGSLPCRS